MHHLAVPCDLDGSLADLDFNPVLAVTHLHLVGEHYTLRGCSVRFTIDEHYNVAPPEADLHGTLLEP